MSNCNTGAGAAILSARAAAETTPLLRPDRHADDGDDASGENQSSINWRRHLKIRCTNSAQIFNVIALSIILFGGVIVSVWLYIDRPGNTQSCDERCMLHLTTRQDWGAEPPRKNISQGARPAVYVIISHTVTSPCNSSVACKSELKAMQLNNFKRNFTDIKYSFLVGGDGFTYEGRGWEAENAIAPHFDPTSLGIAFIGNFESVTPPEEQLNQAKSLIQEALYQQKLSQDYKLVAHRQVAHTNSPGFALFSLIKTWKHWENCYMESC
ncbi:peptidoglycan-recognition protein SD-like isoform X1 [Schistocerca nitens]|uniref:peptidoglycan-recognition protein SD-like isoform X1 n=1 Tax=Schistocerca nitens TaxID=7011 RepID=UPI0021198313|nr:peptidoglycan-recognition protein SD-like isoform X1 [Schistocerca nitens]